jgi:choline-sulfatase
MNGEHGMWRKSNMYEASSRIPLQIAWPGHIPDGSRVSQNVSLVDLVATIVEAAGAAHEAAPLDGDSLMPLMHGDTESWKDEAFCEYLAHGVVRPVSMFKKGDYKLNISLGDSPELFNIVEDPGEFDDLSQSAEHGKILNDMHERLLQIWGDPEEIEQRVLRSQRQRRFIETTGTAGS